MSGYFKFKTGDRVRVLPSYNTWVHGTEGKNPSPGSLGTVVQDNSDMPYVAWDGMTDGHEGAFAEGSRRDIWAVDQDDMELVSSEAAAVPVGVEIAAIAAVVSALSTLTTFTERKRVLDYAFSRFRS